MRRSWLTIRAEHPANDRDQAEADHGVDQRQQRQVRRHRGRGAPELSAEDQRAAMPGSGRSPPSSVLPSRRGIAVKGRPRARLSRPRLTSRIASPPGDRKQVLPPAPVELAGAEHLAEEDQAEQRGGAVEDVLEGRDVLAEQRQPGAAKTRARTRELDRRRGSPAAFCQRASILRRRCSPGSTTACSTRCEPAGTARRSSRSSSGSAASASTAQSGSRSAWSFALIDPDRRDEWLLAGALGPFAIGINFAVKLARPQRSARCWKACRRSAALRARSAFPRRTPPLPSPLPPR